MKRAMSRCLAIAPAAMLLATTAAHAQSSVTISGYLDIGIYKDAGGPLSVGSIQRSNIAFSGTEDLGGGMAATFKLSHRFDPSTGGPESATKPFWHGESTVGLKGGFGAVQFGRRLDAISNNDWQFDPWGNFNRVASPAWDLWHYNFPSDPKGNSGTAEYGRLNNGIFYDSPSFGGFALHLSGSPETVATDARKPIAASLTYNSDRFAAMVGHGRNSANDTDTFLGGRVNLSPVALMAAYDVSKSGASKAKSLTAGVEYAIGAATLRAGWGQVDVNGVKAEKVFGAGANYALSKRTSIYADVARKRFVASSATTYGAGIAHAF